MCLPAPGAMPAGPRRESRLDWFYILGIALALTMDVFAVAVAIGIVIDRLHFGHVFRLSFQFGLFHFMMPVLGWLAGLSLRVWISSFDHWVAFGLLTFIGGKMLWDSFRAKGADARGDPTRGWMLVTLSLATSIDALAVGVGMAMLRVSIWMPGVVIGLMAAGMTAIGLKFGGRIGDRLGRWAERAGGCILLAIGLRILVSHVAVM